MAIDRRKYLYRIKRLEIKSWLKYLMIEGKHAVDYVLGELMSGTEITINNTVEKTFYKFDIKGNSVQDGTPTPDSPVEILSSGDNNSISEKIVNKNLFDKNNFNYVDGKRLDDNGNIVNDADSSYSTTLIKVKPSTTYAIQGTQSITGKTTRIYYYDKNKTFLSRSSNYATDSYSFTTPSNCYYIALQLRNSTYINLDIIQIEEGSTATTYTAHQEQTYTIPVQQPMRSIGLVRDEFIQVNEEWKERHNIAYIESYNGETITTDYISTTGGLDIGASVQYILATPQDLPCTSEQIAILENLPKSYNEQTNIYSLDVTPAYLEVQAYVKKEEVIEND